MPTRLLADRPATSGAPLNGGRPPGRAGTGRDLFTLALLLLGGLLVGVGWIVGVALLWTSATWTRRQKVTATLVVPGGLVGAAFAVSLLAAVTHGIPNSLLDIVFVVAAVASVWVMGSLWTTVRHGPITG